MAHTPGGHIGTGSQPAPSRFFELEVAAEATAAAITIVANSRRSDFFMGFPLSNAA